MIRFKIQSILILLSVIILFSVQCGKKSDDDTAASGPKINKIFVGNINKTLDIKMKLCIQGNKITGTYVYTKHNKDISLKGKVEKGLYMIDELDNKGKKTGLFITKVMKPGIITGIWSTPDKSKKFAFLLEEVYNDLAEGQTITGHYVNKDVDASIDVLYLGDGKVKFQGSSTWMGENPDQVHTGEIGQITEIKENKIIYSQGTGEYDCNLEIFFQNSSLVVSEKGSCGGVNVTFAGNYSKKEDAVPNWDTFHLIQ